MDVVLKTALAQISAPRGAGLSASQGGEAGRSGFVAAEVRLSLDEGSRPRVLLVEDNPVNQVVALEFLTMMGVVAVLAAAAWLLYRRRAIAAAGKPGHSAGALRQSAPKQAGPKHTGKN